MIDFTYTEEQKKLYNTIIAFAKKELNFGVIERDKTQQFSIESWKKCGGLQLQGLCVPKQNGGMGLDAISSAIALEALGYGCTDGGLSFAIGAHLLACAVPIVLYGSEEQKNKYLPKISCGEIIAANAITESESGSNVFDLKTTALKNTDGYVVNGIKTYVSNAPMADIIILYALTNAEKGFYGGISAFIIDKNTKGLSCSAPFDKMGLRTCLMGPVELNNVLINNAAMLGKEGSGSVMFLESMNWERTLLSAIHVGTMQRIIEQCIEYVNHRKINNQAIGKNQAIAHKIVDMQVKLEASRLMVYKAANELDKKSKQISIHASSAKLFVSEALNEVCNSAQSVFGASGYLTNTEMERFVRDAIASKTYSGTNDIQKNIIANSLGL